MRRTLIIRHIGKDPDRFQVTRLEDGNGTPNPVEIPSPDGFPVEGRPDSNLSAELRWCLERVSRLPVSSGYGRGGAGSGKSEKMGRACF